MCLGVPAKLIYKCGDKGRVRIGDAEIDVNLKLVPEVKVGEFVILHAGFAIQVLDEDAAYETLRMLDKII
jgi:hydrogenase expression/formation protein HypC